MLLLRYQRQRALEAEEGCGRDMSAEIDVRRKLNDRDLKGESHRAATRGTLICIFVCGSLLFSLGLALLLAGLLIPKLKKDPTPWMVTGPTCIVLGILVLLLSVEIIFKLRKISSGSNGQSDSRSSPPKETKRGWEGDDMEDVDFEAELKDIDHLNSGIPVIIQPPTPMKHQDTAIV